MDQNSHSTVSIDVIVASYNRPHFLRRCLESLSRASVSGIHLRILVSLRQSDEISRHLLEKMQSDYSQLQFWSFDENLSPGAARNRVLKFAQSDWLFFLDDDAYVDEFFFVRFRNLIHAGLSAPIVGGPNLTPDHSTRFQRASGAILASQFGTFVSSARYWPHLPPTEKCGEETLTSCNLFVRRSAMQDQRFPEVIVSNEENWLLQDLKQMGLGFFYHPDLSVWHERREQPLEFLRQVYRYGVGRGQNSRARPSTGRFFHFVPSMCLLFSVATVIAGPWFPVLALIWLALFTTYFLLWSFAIIRIKYSFSESMAVCLVGGLLFPMIHASYGLGVLKGIAK